ncbi:MAG: GTPase HflX [Candidatus Nanopelagicales bacterium]|nr:GTPase HflX [Candidatus Nanopelagicales bacterium]
MRDEFRAGATSDGALHSAERETLRRVPGLSTELRDVSEVEYRQIRLERVVLMGVWTTGTAADAENSLAELARLAETAGSVVLDSLIQRRDKPDPATYVGSGKAKELAEIVATAEADTLICDGELTPGQLRKLEEVVRVKVVDRTWLILDIFAQHAKSREGKTQVELAQLRYMLPRLRGWGESMSRQAGGIGTRGPGETKIETDRRRIRTQMARLRRQLASMGKTRDVQRHDRQRRAVPAVAIVGYTNAGKSSLFNRIAGADALVRDELFATLDPTVRRAKTSSGREFTISDTVGFVRHLPHQLVESFGSTLEEVRRTDLLLHVVDGSDPDPVAQVRAVRAVLAEIDAYDIPELIVVNKADIARPEALTLIRRLAPSALAVSALTGDGMPELMEKLEAEIPAPAVAVRLVVPFDRGDVVSLIYARGDVARCQYVARGAAVEASVPAWLAERTREFAVTPGNPWPDWDRSA